MARVATGLQDARLPVELTLQNVTEGWQVFSVTFDPARVSHEQVQEILEAAGARVMPAPSS